MSAVGQGGHDSRGFRFQQRMQMEGANYVSKLFTSRRGLSTSKPAKDAPNDSQEHRQEIRGPRPPSPLRPTLAEDPFSIILSNYKFFPRPESTEQTVVGWREYFAANLNEAKFLAFLSLYGSNGVPLRELIMLATLRTSLKPSENHWLLSGEIGPILRPIGDARLPTKCGFLKAFVREVSSSVGVDGLQERLLSMGFILVETLAKTPATTPSPLDDKWCTDERIWRIADNQITSRFMVPMWHDSDGENIIMDLLYVFLEMPSKDISPLAERHRETFYYHARLFALQALRFNQTTLQNARDYIVALVLQLLTHRYQDGDEELMQFAKEWPSSVNGSDWAIMLLSAELKEVFFCGGLKITTALTNRITSLFSWKGKRQRRANGLMGYLLVDWLKATEASHEKILISQIVKLATDWAEGAWHSGSSLECAALCCVLANFQIMPTLSSSSSERSALLSLRYSFFYGYHLSRAGHLEQARGWLVSGLRFYYTPQLDTDLRGYQFELVSVLIRLGRWEVAEVWLSLIEQRAMHRNANKGDLQHRKRLGEHAETRILLGLYRAECLMAAGKVSHAGHWLEKAISTASLVHDAYIRSLRLTLEMRLLEIRSWEGSLEKALTIATELGIEVLGASLEQDMVQWIIQQFVALSNRLAWVGNASAASQLMDTILQISQYSRYSDSLSDILPYAEQRWATDNDLLTIDHAKGGPIASGLEGNAATDESPECLPTFDARGTSSTKILNDPWRPVNMRSSGTELEIRPNAQQALDGFHFIEEPKDSNPPTHEPTEKAPLRKSTKPRKTSEKRPALRQARKKLVEMAPLAAMLRRAPRVPAAEPGSTIAGFRETESSHASTETPVVHELATASFL